MCKFLLALGLLFATPAAAQVDDRLLLETARREGAFNPVLVVAVIKIESGGNPRALNQGHYGLMQLAPATARLMGFVGPTANLFNWKVNLRYGTRYLNYQAERYDGHITQVLAAYNAGTALLCGRRQRCTEGRFINHGYVKTTLINYRRLVEEFGPKIP